MVWSFYFINAILIFIEIFFNLKVNYVIIESKLSKIGYIKSILYYYAVKEE
jgi:hypothetical protein